MSQEIEDKGNIRETGDTTDRVTPHLILKSLTNNSPTDGLPGLVRVDLPSLGLEERLDEVESRRTCPGRERRFSRVSGGEQF